MIAHQIATALPDRQGASCDTGGLASARRLVLDTNVLLDLFVFNDPRVAALARAMKHGKVSVFTEPGCLEEFRQVLRYPVFSLADGDQARMVCAYLEVAVQSPPPVAPSDAFRLRCSDPDDQKFLELAWRTGATLLTRDKALLVLRRRFTACGGATICTPESLFFIACAGSDITR